GGAPGDAAAGRRARSLSRPARSPVRSHRHLGDRISPGAGRREPGQGMDQGHLADALPRYSAGGGESSLRGGLWRARGKSVSEERIRTDAFSLPAAVHGSAAQALIGRNASPEECGLGLVVAFWVCCQYSNQSKKTRDFSASSGGEFHA